VVEALINQLSVCFVAELATLFYHWLVLWNY